MDKKRLLRIIGITIIIYAFYSILMHGTTIKSAIPGFTIGILVLAAATYKTKK